MPTDCTPTALRAGITTFNLIIHTHHHASVHGKLQRIGNTFVDLLVGLNRYLIAASTAKFL